jgi:transposase
MAKVVGIDVSQATLDVVVMDEQRQSIYGQFENSSSGHGALVRWLKKHKAQGSTVCLEATGCYAEAIADYLYSAKYRVSVVNPAHIRGYADSQLWRNKTDKLDATLIADFCRTQSPEA